MNDKHLLKSLGTPVQVAILLVFSVCCAIIFIGLAGLAIWSIWDINIFMDTTTLTRYDLPEVIEANKLLLLFQHLGLFITPALLFGYLAQRAPVRYLSLDIKPDVRLIIVAIMLMICVQPVVSWVGEWNAGLKLPESMASLENTIRVMEDSAAELTKAILLTSDTGMLLINMFLLALIPAIGEEMIFRGILQRQVMKGMGKAHLAVWTTAILFSFFHFQFFGFFPRMILGAMLGYLFLWSGSLWLPIAAHFTNNLLGIVIYFLAARGTISEEWLNMDHAPVSLGMVAVSLAVSLGLMYLIMRQRRDNKITFQD
ncbi:MAG: CPBP family intramembrane metalloprotease [Flavobacteriales bacterium]|nr:CPBP family intramembrane metalloprotease [Flavobacteriales bacterium]